MGNHFAPNTQSHAGQDATGNRAAWTTPRVIVSDLGDARANTIIPGGDGTNPSNCAAYGS